MRDFCRNSASEISEGISRNCLVKISQNRRQRYRRNSWRNTSINLWGIHGAFSEGILGRTTRYFYRKNVLCNFWTDYFNTISTQNPKFLRETLQKQKKMEEFFEYLLDNKKRIIEGIFKIIHGNNRLETGERSVDFHTKISWKNPRKMQMEKFLQKLLRECLQKKTEVISKE